jgi:hypothetical protein
MLWLVQAIKIALMHYSFTFDSNDLYIRYSVNRCVVLFIYMKLLNLTQLKAVLV